VLLFLAALRSCLVLYTPQAGRTLRAGGRAGPPPPPQYMLRRALASPRVGARITRVRFSTKSNYLSHFLSHLTLPLTHTHHSLNHPLAPPRRTSHLQVFLRTTGGGAGVLSAERRGGPPTGSICTTGLRPKTAGRKSDSRIMLSAAKARCSCLVTRQLTPALRAMQLCTSGRLLPGLIYRIKHKIPHGPKPLSFGYCHIHASAQVGVLRGLTIVKALAFEPPL
jgi:hypothetical protein